MCSKGETAFDVAWNVGHASGGLIGTQHKIIKSPGAIHSVRVMGSSGDLTQVTRRDQVIEGLRRLLLVQRVLLNGAAHGLQVLLEYRPLAREQWIAFVNAPRPCQSR